MEYYLRPSKQLDYDEDELLLRRYNWPYMVKRTIQELHGVSGAIIYDKKITDDEIALLKGFMQQCNEYAYIWPISELSEILQDILSDGIVTDEERLKLLSFLEKIAIGPDAPKTIQDVFEENPKITFRNRKFMFTGKLQFGKRKKAEGEVVKKGGLIEGSAFKELDYLVVGVQGSEQWKYSRYGNKLEKVLNLKKKYGTKTFIIKEEDFIRAVIGNPR